MDEGRRASRVPRPAPGAGFTLVEVLVVVVIVGVLALAVTLAIGRPAERRLAREADRFAALAAHACAHAELSGRDVGIALLARGYGFSRFDGDGWRPLPADGELRARDWPEGLEARLSRDGRPVRIAEAADRPQLVCFASGELTPFDLVLRLGDAEEARRVRGEGDGRLRVDAVAPR
ncbi:type II secretion system minor pseudopilin GspH [Dokdonella koreensis]|uniref:Type II secretion system protein H n=1 Tax=Dokdonella koreensis DS-123 TaxID=1300342 RepID=A0A160DXP8_9GAMM|nr:type II secretion system minor pseudopilin GspH [Dokdonella koreensis]ANB18743.1 General secretion pathway protein GspH [Dokdonella koreensis DS-123]